MTCLLMLAAFALAPLAQGVACIMHVPVETQAHEHGHHSQDDTSNMVVADCFAAAMHGVVTGEAVFKLPLVAEGELSIPWQLRPAPAPLRIAMAPWRGPPPDVLTTNQRRRI